MREAQVHTSAWASKDGYFYSYARSTSTYVSTDVLRRLFQRICEMHKHTFVSLGLLKEVISTHMREAQAHTSARTSKGGYFYSNARCTYARSTHVRQHWLLKMTISSHMRDAQVHTSAWASKDGYFYSYANCTSTYVSTDV